MRGYDEGKYEFVLAGAGDEPNEGMALEVWEDEALILLAFRSDSGDSFTFTAFKANLPFALVESFLQRARKSLVFADQNLEPLQPDN